MTIGKLMFYAKVCVTHHRMSEPDTCVFEVKEGPFVSHKEGGILE